MPDWQAAVKELEESNVSDSQSKGGSVGDMHHLFSR